MEMLAVLLAVVGLLRERAPDRDAESAAKIQQRCVVTVGIHGNEFARFYEFSTTGCDGLEKRVVVTGKLGNKARFLREEAFQVLRANRTT